MTIPTQEKLEEDDTISFKEIFEAITEDIAEAAKNYERLITLHGPDSIQSLLSGESWIAPNEPTELMTWVADAKVHLKARLEGDYPSIEEIYQAMRQAAKEKSDE